MADEKAELAAAIGWACDMIAQGAPAHLARLCAAAERLAGAEAELEKAERGLLAAHTTLVCVEREADALRAQLAAQAEKVAELRAELEFRDRLLNVACSNCQRAARAALAAGAEGE